MLNNKVNALAEKKHFAVVLFFVYLLLSLFLYRHTIGSRLVTDAQNWLILYDAIGWNGVLNSFGENALHPVYHFFFFLSYQIFGTNETGWYLLFTSLHAINAALIFTVFKKYFSFVKIQDKNLISISASFLFLLSPYQTEAVVWGATIHYLLVTLCTLLIINLVLLYTENNKRKYLLPIPLLFCFALLSLELALCIPIILIILFLFKKRDEGITPKQKILTHIISPLLILTAGYFVANKIILGDWVGHYGAATHLKFSVMEFFTNFNKYIFKFLFFGNFIIGSLNEKTKGFLDNNTIIYIGLIVYGSVIGFYIFLKKIRFAINKSVLLFLCFGAALLPVLNLFFNTLPIEGDRLGYLASAFFYLTFSLLIFSLFQKSGLILIIFFSIFSIFLLDKNLRSWKNSAIVQQGLENNYTWTDAENVYVLNIPDNFNGAYLYRDNGSTSKFKAALALKKEEKIQGDIHEILQYNMTSTDNSVSIEIMDSTTLKVTFDQWGNWWWRGGIGASNYENDLYKVTIDEWSHAYMVTFKQKRPGDVFIYQKGISWQRVNGF